MNARRTKCFFLVAAAFFIFTTVGCRDQKSETSTTEKAADIQSENLLAYIGNEEVTRADVEAMLDKIPEKRRELLKKRVLDDLIEIRVFAKEARKKGLEKDPEVLSALEKERKELLAQNFVSMRLDQEVLPTEENLKAYYETHKGEFLVPEGVFVQQIVVEDLGEAKEILDELKKGANFKDLAQKVSVARSKQGLEVEKWFYKGKTDPDLDKTVFNLEKEALSDIVQYKNRYHIFKLMEKSSPRHFTFDEARDKIRTKVFWEEKRKVIEKYYQAAGVNIHPTEPGVLATIGDVTITEKSLEPILSKVAEGEREKLKMRWVDYFIETTVFAKEAEKVGLHNDPDIMKKLRLKEDRLLAKAFRERHLNTAAEITDEQIKKYYDEHQNTFMLPEKVRLKSILVKTRQEAEEILKTLGEEEEAFGYVAQKRSLHPRANERAGEIGWFAKGQLDPALEEAAFSLEKEQMSGVVETKDGFEIIKVMDKKGGGLRPLDEVAASIKMNLIMENFEKIKAQYYETAGVRIVRQYE